MENNTFIYSYSAKQNKEAESIRKKYLPKEENKLQTLRKLDRRAQTAGILPALCLGIIGALVFGIGMCFGLDVFAGADYFTLLFMAFGTLLMIPAYPIYRRIARKTKAKLAPEILRLSDEIIKNEQ